MTLEEAKSNALQGDYESIMSLGRYYFGEVADEQNKDIDEAIRWYEKGGEFGYSRCMYLASILYTIKGHAIRKISGGNQTPDDAIPKLERGLYWAQKAEELGEDKADEQIVSIIGEIGIAYFYCARGGEYIKPTKENSIAWYSESIRLLKSVYTETNDPEVYVILALALNFYGEIVGYTNENNKLEFYLYNKIINEYFGKVMHSDICACYLGLMYTYGRGWPVDYNKAVYYFQKAHNAGFDCSEMLAHFKKTLLGGWKLK